MVVEGETTAEADYCLCPSPKTRLQVETNNNTCPTCQKMLIEKPEPKPEPKYEDMPALEGTGDGNKVKNSDKDESEDIRGLLKGLASLRSTKDRKDRNNDVRLKPPTYKGDSEPTHFFVKLENFLEHQSVSKEIDKIRIMKSCLEGPALDLYLCLDKTTQTDIVMLEKKFKTHFRPNGHTIVEEKNFVRTYRQQDETISQYYAKLRKKASELLIEEALQF